MGELSASGEAICPTLDAYQSMQVQAKSVVPPTATTGLDYNADPSVIDIQNGRAVPL
jgi:hypothetical protein